MMQKSVSYTENTFKIVFIVARSKFIYPTGQTAATRKVVRHTLASFAYSLTIMTMM
jgi:hypothetical protein